MEISADRKRSQSIRISVDAVFLFTIGLLTATFFRISLFFIYPLVVAAFLFYFRLRFMNVLLVLLSLIAGGWLISLINGFYPKYNLLSWYYMIPFLVLLFSTPRAGGFGRHDYVALFFKILSILAASNDVIGFLQVLIKPDSDDNFMGIYSSFGISLNGLSLLNLIVSFYYFSLFIVGRGKKDFWLFAFFLASGLLGFFGAGLLVFILAFILSFLKWRLTKILKTIFVALIVLVAAYYSLLFIRPKVLNYNKANIQKILSFDIQNGPRKIIAFYNYATSYPKHWRDFLLGSGPGTFNSRSAFIVGSPSYFTAFEILKSSKQPYYFKNYAYTLWNDKNTSQARYEDGFRNQPFSSILAFLGEYGLIFTLVLSIGYISYLRRVRRIRTDKSDKQCQSYRLTFRFLSVFFPMLLLIDNLLEFPEMVLLILVIMKLVHLELLKKENSRDTGPNEILLR